MENAWIAFGNHKHMLFFYTEWNFQVIWFSVHHTVHYTSHRIQVLMQISVGVKALLGYFFMVFVHYWVSGPLVQPKRIRPTIDPPQTEARSKAKAQCASDHGQYTSQFREKKGLFYFS